MTAQTWFHPPRSHALETLALEQALVLAAQTNTIALAGLPDMHPGKGGPVGLAMLGEFPVPAVLGNDLGCGFALYRLDLKAKRLADPAWVGDRLNGLDAPMDDRSTDLGFQTPHDLSLGTIGGGNHFIEIGVVHASQDDSVLTKGQGTLLVHTGSRGFGEAVFRQVVAHCRDMPLQDWSAWLAMHDQCMLWAAANRDLAARRAAEALGADISLVLDLPHNFIECTPAGWLHRKGASPADRGMSVLPGSRGTPTFLVQPHAQVCRQISLASLPHGAGRRISRSSARNNTVSPESLRDTAPLAAGRRGSRVVCGDAELLLEERPGAYKDVWSVLGGLEDAGMGSLVAELHPVATFKRSETVQGEAGRDRTRSAHARAQSIAIRRRNRE